MVTLDVSNRHSRRLTTEEKPSVRCGVHPAIFLLALTALLIRFIIPAGWMPASEGGTFSIMPCMVDTAIHSDKASQPDQHPDQDVMRVLCPFTALSAVATDTPGPLFLPALVFVAFLFLAQPVLAIRKRTLRLYPPSQGPPQA